MGAQQPKQFRRSKLRRISAVVELISGRDSKAFQMGRRSGRRLRLTFGNQGVKELLAIVADQQDARFVHT
jgi:hypothetical protein